MVTGYAATMEYTDAVASSTEARTSSEGAKQHMRYDSAQKAICVQSSCDVPELQQKEYEACMAATD